jgi:hypothetical protein
MNNTTKFDGPKDTAQMKLEISQYVDLLKCVEDVIQVMLRLRNMLIWCGPDAPVE